MTEPFGYGALMNLVSDGIGVLSCALSAFALLFRGLNRGDRHEQPISVVLAGLIVGCGAIVAADLATLLTATSGLAGEIRMVGATLALATTIALWLRLPRRPVPSVAEPVERHTTEPTQSNQSLAATNDVLVHKIAHHTQAESDPAHDRTKAETAHCARIEFLTKIIHEIRTPMNAISGLIYLLEQTDLSPLQLDYVQKAEISAQSLLGILNDILDVSRIESGQITLEQTPFQLDDVMKTLAALTTADARDRNIEVLFTVAPDTPPCLIGDPARLQQLLAHLTDNAVMFTEQGEVVVSVWAEGLPSDTVCLIFEVRDTGIGIPSHKINSLFEGFFQGDARAARRMGGSGLGLTICKRLATLMGGDIVVESVPGQGSTFRFTAPFRLGPSPSGNLVATPALIRPLRVLVVDDNTTACTVMAALIAPFGWEVVIADSGRTAIASIERSVSNATPFDLILLDWRMPEISGQDVLRYARNRCGPTAMPTILVVTAFEEEMVRREAHDDASVAVILTKPVTSSVLFDAVTRACAAAPKQHPTPPPAALSGGATLAGISLLLVEDNAINQLVARRVLETAGATVTAASGGGEAIAMLTATPNRFDAVLMDVQMPGMDGFETTRILRQTLGLTSLPVIAVTADALPADRERCLAAGMNAHLGKPIAVEALFSTLATMIPARPPQGTGTAPLSVAPPSLPVWPEIPGIDGPEIARRLLGDQALFQGLLSHFDQQFSDAAQRIRTFLAAGNRGDALRLAHTLRGIAANLAARNIASLAGALEAAISSTEAPQNPPTDALLYALAVTLKDLGSAIKPQNQQHPIQPPATDAVGNTDTSVPFSLDAVTALLRTLESHNLTALDQITDIRPALSQRYGVKLTDHLTTKIEQLEFTEAVSILRRCVEVKTP